MRSGKNIRTGMVLSVSKGSTPAFRFEVTDGKKWPVSDDRSKYNHAVIHNQHVIEFSGINKNWTIHGK